MNPLQLSDNFRFVCRMLLLRHGESNYTHRYPDLTKEGKATVTRSAEKIKQLIDKECKVSIICSPAQRARGSADIIANVISYEEIMQIEELLGSAKVADKERGKAIYNSFIDLGGHNRLGIEYARNPIFEDSSWIEPRKSVQNRMAEFLINIVKTALTSSIPKCFICVSHYETLYRLAERIFKLNYPKDKPLSFGEIMDLTFYQKLGKKELLVKANFRGKEKNCVFFLPL